MSIQDNEAIVRLFLDQAYNKKNLAKGDELLADDCVFHALPKAIQGIAGVENVRYGVSHGPS